MSINKLKEIRKNTAKVEKIPIVGKILKEWSKKYNINYLNYDYNNCNYQNNDNKNNKTIEVLITNY